MNFVNEPAAYAVVAVTIGLLIHIAWYDYTHLKIRNGEVLVLLGLYLAFAVLTGFKSLASDIAASAVLFIPAFVMWLLRLIGAGDVKLYFGLGLFMGFGGLGIFSVFLLIVSLLFLLCLYAAKSSHSITGSIGRLREIHVSGRVPYAVILCSSAIPVILMRVLAHA